MKIKAKLIKNGVVIHEAENGFSKDRNLLPTREDRLEHALHAEMRLLIADRSESGGKELFINLAPCKQCAGYIAESDIDTIHVPSEIPERWRDGWNSCVDGLNIISEAGIKIKFLPINSGDELPTQT